MFSFSFQNSILTLKKYGLKDLRKDKRSKQNAEKIKQYHHHKNKTNTIIIVVAAVVTAAATPFVSSPLK